MNTNSTGTPNNLQGSLGALFQRYNGKVADWVPAKPQDKITVKVVVEDIRNSYGRVDFLVTPVSGSGSLWVQDKALTFQDG